MSILIVRTPQGDKPLTRAVWYFVYFEDRHALVLDSYDAQVRESTRHKFHSTSSYRRLGHERNALGDRVPEENVPLPDGVLQEARSEFAKMLRVIRWSARDQ